MSFPFAIEEMEKLSLTSDGMKLKKEWHKGRKEGGVKGKGMNGSEGKPMVFLKVELSSVQLILKSG